MGEVLAGGLTNKNLLRAGPGLCTAEAQRTGKSVEEVEEAYSEPAEHCRDDKPRLVECREVVRKAINSIRENAATEPWSSELVEQLERIA